MFAVEGVMSFQYYPASYMAYEKWDRLKSELIKKWASDIYFRDDFMDTRYFPEIDRTCSIISIESDNDYFYVKVMVSRSITEYMVVDLCYRTSLINYA